MTPAQEIRLLRRESEPLSAAGLKIYALKQALFEANDQGVDTEMRASGDLFDDVRRED